jgi:hypothetical protein
VAQVAGKQCAWDRARSNLEHALVLATRLPPKERVGTELEILNSLAGISLATMDAAGVLDRVTLLRKRAAEHGLIDVEVSALIEMARDAWCGGSW